MVLSLGFELSVGTFPSSSLSTSGSSSTSSGRENVFARGEDFRCCWCSSSSRRGPERDGMDLRLSDSDTPAEGCKREFPIFAGIDCRPFVGLDGCWVEEACKPLSGEVGDDGDSDRPARRERADGLKYPHFGQTYSTKTELSQLLSSSETGQKSHSRASSQSSSFTRPLCVKHFWQISAYLFAEAFMLRSSSPINASASLSYHCLRPGDIGVCDTGEDGHVSIQQFYVSNKRLVPKGDAPVAIAAGAPPFGNGCP